MRRTRRWRPFFPDFDFISFYYADSEVGEPLLQRLRGWIREEAPKAKAVVAHSLGAALLGLAVADPGCRCALGRKPILLTNPVLLPRRQSSTLKAIAVATSALRVCGVLSASLILLSTVRVPKALLIQVGDLTFKDRGCIGFEPARVAQLIWAVGELDAATCGKDIWEGVDVSVIHGTDDELTPVGVWWPRVRRSVLCKHEPFNDDAAVARAWAVEARRLLFGTRGRTV